MLVSWLRVIIVAGKKSSQRDGKGGALSRALCENFIGPTSTKPVLQFMRVGAPCSWSCNNFAISDALSNGLFS
jgi:hypothetical protein